MTAPDRDPLAGWRAARAAQAAGTVATVATAFPVVATPGNPQESAIVATVSTVAPENNQGCIARAAQTARAAALVAAAEAGAAALAGREPDPVEAAERAAHFGNDGEAQPYQPGDPDPLRDGLLAGALQRPPAWPDPSLLPPPGAWCSCCGRFDRKGGRWWTTSPEPDGWACVTCHPPDHLPAEAVWIVAT